ncbi:MAG: [FeFe] hydrogenase H-cluster maturation GTPase HydF, partial [Vicinamibacteria bacterium]|nr:[FeFe] hydrogenase H-cluster maturation GTPase HydF [Vicinamibacteria bacterium]
IECVRGTMAIESLKPGDRVLIAEACTHHPNDEDIGRVKIPRWLTQRVGGALRIDHSAGRELPADLADYRLVVQCGSCMLGRREVLGRMRRCADAGVPVTNYGLAIAHSLGVLDRALQPFPEALEVSRSKRRAD